MEENSRGNMPGRETTLGTMERTIRLTRFELQQMIEEAGRNAIMACERITTTPVEKEATKKKLFKEKHQEIVSKGTSKKETEKGHHASLEVGSSNRDLSQLRGPTISRAELDSVGKHIAMLEKQIDELK
ncbi:UNVERIFIED_CONTAM: hypothetical protein Sindi_0045400 [Sesamum indicum]